MRWLGMLALLMVTSAVGQELSGTLSIAGSDTLAGAVTRSAEAFQSAHPKVHVQVQTLGSASAVAALLDGAVDIGSMSRDLSNAEGDSLTRYSGSAARQVAIARDGLVVFVHPDNPLRQISLQQIDAVFAKSPSCGLQPKRRWSDLGVQLAGLPADTQILPIGRNAASGTHAFFQQAALCGDAYRDDVVDWPGNGAVVHAVAENREAIGYAAAGSVGAPVRALGIVDQAGNIISLDAESLRNGRYPLGRELYLVANRDARGRLRPLTLAFMAYMLSDAAQPGLRREGLQTISDIERAAAVATLSESDHD
ncbi:MAG: phosphate ABC transporter substrate-binding protein [Dokdonella sp.]